MDKSIKEMLNLLLDTFGGTDGGISFIKFKCMLETLEQNTDMASKEILTIVKKFCILIEIAQNPPINKAQQ